MEGTYPLPEAQLDRFLFKLRLDYPDRDELHEIVNRTTTNVQPRATAVLAKERLLAMRRLLLEVPVAPSVQDFAIRLVLATHPDRPATPKPVQRYVRYGASPRGAQALLLGAKVKALLDGRFAVATEDIRSVALPALRHRIILSFEGEAQGIATDQIIDELLQSVSEQPE